MNSTRRSFVTASAFAAAPFFIKAEKKSGGALPVVGEGEHTYECIHDWGELPASIKYGNTHSVCEDAQGHIYIHHTVHANSQSPDSVVVFDSNGKFVRSWGAMFRGGAHGMQYSKEGKDEYLYLADEKHGLVTKRTLKGEEVWTMGYPQDSEPYRRIPGKPSPGLPYRPTNIAIAPNGDFWVGDGYGSSYMFHYSGKGSYPKLRNTFGGPPAKASGKTAGQSELLFNVLSSLYRIQAPGQTAAETNQGSSAPIDSMHTPHGTYVDLRDPAHPILLVADRGNNRIVRYTLEDKPLDIVDGTRSPCHFHEHEGVIVVPDLQSRVTLFDKDNKVLVHLGDGKGAYPAGVRATQDRSNFMPGKFVAPHGAIFDHSGNIFIVEYVEIGRVTKLRKIA
jgi:hypothetical protein